MPSTECNLSPKLAKPVCSAGPTATHEKSWFAVYTAPRHEKSALAQLVGKAVECFLPVYGQQRRWKNGIRKRIEYPLFPGYLFVRISEGERLRVLQTSGVLYVVGNKAVDGRLHDEEVEAMRAGCAHAGLEPHADASAGVLVRVLAGPFTGAEGYAQGQGNELSVIIKLSLIQRSFAMRVHADDIEFIGEEARAVA